MLKSRETDLNHILLLFFPKNFNRYEGDENAIHLRIV